MGAQKGKDLLLKLDFNQDDTLETVAGMRSRRIAFNAEAIDITNADSAGRWRELLEGAGVRRAGIAGAGVFKDADFGCERALAVLRRRDPHLAGDRSGFRHDRRAVPGDGAGICRRARRRGFLRDVAGVGGAVSFAAA